MHGTHVCLHLGYILALPQCPFPYIYMVQKVNYRARAVSCLTNVIKFWEPHENGDPGSPFSL